MMKISDAISKVVKFQDYSKKPVIDGVKVINLKRFNDDGGSLTELARISEGLMNDFSGVKIAQINYSEMDPGTVKAFHIHLKQTDIWYVPPSDKILLFLTDLRDDSPTKNVIMRIVLGDGNSKLVLIPPGVAHGCKNLSHSTSRIIYFMDMNFSEEQDKCDEGRLPWDFFGADVWELQKG